MLILDLWGISFHAVVVFALGKNLLFKFALGHCDVGPNKEHRKEISKRKRQSITISPYRFKDLPTALQVFKETRSLVSIAVIVHMDIAVIRYKTQFCFHS